MSAPLLEAHGLKAFYGSTQALFGLDFVVDNGGVTALLGANGAGKTTTLQGALAASSVAKATFAFKDSRSARFRPRTSPGSASPMFPTAAGRSSI